MTLLGIVLFVIGILLAIISGIWALILAFSESIIWGLLYLFVPFASLVFVFTHFYKKAVRDSFFLALLSIPIMILGANITSMSIRHQKSSSVSTNFSIPINSNDPNSTRFPNPNNQTYTQNMETGYKILAQRNYKEALVYFEKALKQRPGDSYATKAISNTKAYLKRK
jgi:hypothetical protein